MLAVLVGCKKFDPEKQAEIDEDIIVQYIADHGLTALSSPTGLHWTVDSTGTGVQPNSGNSVRVYYKGYLTSGATFDESDANGLSFPLTSVIQGWQEGIPKYHEGGGGKLLIPSALGYGNDEVGTIPANSVLIFDVHLIEVQ